MRITIIDNEKKSIGEVINHMEIIDVKDFCRAFNAIMKGLGYSPRACPSDETTKEIINKILKKGEGNVSYDN